MNESVTKTVQVGPGFPTLLTVLFVALKLTGYIGWSWLWVLSPLWIPIALLLIGIAVYLIIVLGIALVVALKP